MIVFLELTSPRRRKLDILIDDEASPKLTAFLRQFADRVRWNQDSINRLVLVGEETLGSISSEGLEPEEVMQRRLMVTIRATGKGAELEFVSATEGENLQDQLAYLQEPSDIPDVREISFRLLRHYASSVRHKRYQAWTWFRWTWQGLANRT